MEVINILKEEPESYVVTDENHFLARIFLQTSQMKDYFFGYVLSSDLIIVLIDKISLIMQP